MKTRFKAQVIAQLENGVAVEFSSGRVEFVSQNTQAIGTKGWATYRPLPFNNGFVWNFEPFKKENKK